jgi:hypothetical protein
MAPRFSPHRAARRPRLCYVLLSTEEGRIYGTRKSTTKSNAKRKPLLAITGAGACRRL